MTVKSGKGTARQTIRVDENLWHRFGEAAKAAGTDRSEVLRDFIRGYIEPTEKTDGDPNLLAAVPARRRNVVTQHLATVGWTLREFLLASIDMLLANPEPYLNRLKEVRANATKPRGRPRKST